MTVPREEWQSFLEAFGRQHEGWLVTVDGISQQPLESVRLVGKTIEIRAGGSAVRADDVQSIEEIGERGLDIISAKRTLTIRFRVAIDPELVDGAAS